MFKILILLLAGLSLSGCAFLKEFHEEIVNGSPPKDIPTSGMVYTPEGSQYYLIHPNGTVYIGD